MASHRGYRSSRFRWLGALPVVAGLLLATAPVLANAQPAQARAGEEWLPAPNITVDDPARLPITLDDGDVLLIKDVAYSAKTGESPIALADNATATIIVEGTVELNGADAEGRTGATPAIEVPETATLVVYGATTRSSPAPTGRPRTRSSSPAATRRPARTARTARGRRMTGRKRASRRRPAEEVPAVAVVRLPSADAAEMAAQAVWERRGPRRLDGMLAAIGLPTGRIMSSSTSRATRMMTPSGAKGKLAGTEGKARLVAPCTCSDV